MSSLIENEILAPKPTTRRLGVTAFVEERFLVPSYSSSSAPAWIAGHRALSIPFQLYGDARFYNATFAGETVRVAAIGHVKRFQPLFRLLFEKVTQVEAGAGRMAWHPKLLDDIAADLVVAEVHRWVAPSFREAGWVLMPDSVRWAGDTATLPPPTPSRSLREDLKKLQRHEYVLEQVTAWHEWEQFYETMLAPQALSRFGDTAWLPSRWFLKELAENGTLHYVRQDGRRVAGICSIRHGDTIWLPVGGVLDGDPALLRQGVSVATLSLVFAWARAQGATRIDAGRTTPFVKDGIPRSKHKWGLRPVRDPLSHLVGLRVGSNPALRQAFAAQPVFLETEDGLEEYAGQ